MTASITGRCATARGHRYVKQLLSHFHLDAEPDAEGRVTTTFGDVELHCRIEPDAIHVDLAADSTDRVLHIAAVVEKHLVRFGTRDELVIEWSGELGPTYVSQRDVIYAAIAEMKAQRIAQAEADAEEQH